MSGVGCREFWDTWSLGLVSTAALLYMKDQCSVDAGSRQHIETSRLNYIHTATVVVMLL